LSGGSGEFLPLAGGRYWRGFAARAATGEHGPEFCNLCVYPSLLFLESENGGIEYFGGEFVGGHVSCGASILPVQANSTVCELTCLSEAAKGVPDNDSNR
jgi:hypothetical protein